MIDVGASLKRADAEVDLWARVCERLDDGVRVGVIARDRSLLQRFSPPQLPDVAWVRVDDAPEAALLGCHAVVWLTSYPMAFGVDEREYLSALSPMIPTIRAVVLADRELLDQLSDEPAREAADVRERVRGLAAATWQVLDVSELQAVAAWHPVVEARKRDVAVFLLHRGVDRLTAAVDEERRAHAAAMRELSALEAQITAAHDSGTRATAHAAAAMHRHGADLVTSLRMFLQAFEEDVVAQCLTFPDLATLRRVLPHYLQHVVAGHLSDLLSTWRAGVLADLAEVDVDGAALGLDLLLPLLPPSPLRGEADWRRRLALSAAVGGGVALAAFGLWLPAAAVIVGGAGWSAMGRDLRDLESRDRVVASVRQAVRQLAADAERVLSDQLAQAEADLAARPDAVAAAARAALADPIARWSDRRSLHRAQAALLEERLSDARAALAELTGRGAV
jgi:hypothetical protein